MRMFYKKVAVVHYANEISNGSIIPGMEYYREITNGESEAIAIKSLFEIKNR